MTLLHQAAQKAVEASIEKFAKLYEHSGAYMKALAALVNIGSVEFKGSSSDWIDREAAMRLVPALRDHGSALATMLRAELMQSALQHQEEPSDKQIARAFADEQMRQGSGTHNRHEWFRRGALWAASPSTTRQQEVGSEHRMAFCPACFVEVSATEADQRTLDARRYRWLRSADADLSALYRASIDEAEFMNGAELDRAIDAMLAAAPSTPENADGGPHG